MDVLCQTGKFVSEATWQFSTPVSCDGAGVRQAYTERRNERCALKQFVQRLELNFSYMEVLAMFTLYNSLKDNVIEVALADVEKRQGSG